MPRVLRIGLVLLIAAGIGLYRLGARKNATTGPAARVLAVCGTVASWLGGGLLFARPIATEYRGPRLQVTPSAAGPVTRVLQPATVVYHWFRPGPSLAATIAFWAVAAGLVVLPSLIGFLAWRGRRALLLAIGGPLLVVSWVSAPSFGILSLPAAALWLAGGLWPAGRFRWVGALPSLALILFGLNAIRGVLALYRAQF